MAEKTVCLGHRRPKCHGFFLCPRTLEHNLKELRAKDNETMQGVKGSRLSKWIASKDTRRQAAGALEPQKLQNLVSAFSSSKKNGYKLILPLLVQWHS